MFTFFMGGFLKAFTKLKICIKTILKDLALMGSTCRYLIQIIYK